jgi:hypothetical protein
LIPPEGNAPVILTILKINGADMGPTLIEIGAGELIMNTQLKNYYILTGMMRPVQGQANSR